MPKRMRGQYDIGVIVGRFQVPELHAAHLKIINMIKDLHKHYMIFIGVSPTLGCKRHPLGYRQRVEMIREKFPNATISYIMDVHDDKLWSRNLDKAIRELSPLGTICLYGGRDSFIKCYSGGYDTFEIPTIGISEGSSLRTDLGKVSIASADFRRGIIYSTQNQFSKVFPTIDIAITQKEKREQQVLMGIKCGRSKYCFFGGFVDITDITMEDAAKREAMEEVDVAIGDMSYVCSGLIDDWRYPKGGDARIMTTLYQTEYQWGTGKPITYDGVVEFDDTEWIPLNKKSLDLVEPSHKKLFTNLLKYMKGKK